MIQPTNHFKRLFSIVLLIFFTIFLQQGLLAQKNSQPQTHLGVKQGVSFAKVKLISQDHLIGYSGGVVLNHVSQPHLGIQLEINFNQLSWKDADDSNQKLNYIQVPFMTYIAVSKKKIRFSFNVGPYISFLISDLKNMITNVSNSVTPQELDAINSVDLGFTLGIGGMLDTPVGNFRLETQGNLGSDAIFDSDKRWFDTGFAVSIYYLLDFQRLVRKR